MGVDGPGPRIPGTRAERVRVDRRNEAVHGRRSDAPLRGREEGAETTVTGVPKARRKHRRNRGPKMVPLTWRKSTHSQGQIFSATPINSVIQDGPMECLRGILLR